MEITGPKIAFEFDVLGYHMIVSETVVTGWIVMAIITAVVLFLTHNMQKIPTKKQAIAEWIVEVANKLVMDTMGKEHISYAPYISAVFAFSLFGSFISLLGFRPITADFSTTLCWALMTFVLIQANKIRSNGILGYFKSFTKPIAMTPMNIISEIATPISMSFRHFGNTAGSMVIISLVYFALEGASKAIGLPENLPLLTIGLPAILGLYFDLFAGLMQAFIFIMLTMVLVGDTTQEE